MVTRINLLPPEIRQKDRTERIIVLMFLSLVVVVAALAGIYFWKDSQVNRAQNELAQAQSRSKAIDASIAKLTAYQSRESELKRLQEILAGAVSVSPVWSKTMNDISLTMPNDVVVTQIDCDSTGVTFKAYVPTLTQASVGTKPVANWMKALNASGNFNYVWLTSSKLQQPNTPESKLSIEIKASFKEPTAIKSAAATPPPVKK
jgi:Tfp pilus assembly protein PilN